MFRSSVKSTGYPLHSSVSPSLSLPCITVCHHISTGLYFLKPIQPWAGDGISDIRYVLQPSKLPSCREFFFGDNLLQVSAVQTAILREERQMISIKNDTIIEVTDLSTI
jgi:hypothetical protein